jgi:3'5'-cyclic nucleotide phosphodiesterase
MRSLFSRSGKISRSPSFNQALSVQSSNKSFKCAEDKSDEIDIITDMKQFSRIKAQTNVVRKSLDLACHVAMNMMSDDPEVYHNDRHVRDVADFLKEAIRELPDDLMFDKNKERCMITAALMHDVCHPAGKSNKEIHDNMVEILCDDSHSNHLETIHAQIAISLLNKSNSFASLGTVVQARNYDFITEMIKATDMATYFEEEEDEEKAIAKLIIRCADLCHVTKDMDYHMLNVKALNTELGIVLTSEQNANFLKKFALPLFNKLDDICKTEKTAEWVAAVENKIVYWSL